MLEGEAKTPDGSWRFRHPALACDETPMVAMWLTTVADWLEAGRQDFAPPALSFAAPALSFRLAEAANADCIVIAINLDREFKPPWQRFAGSTPYVMAVRLDVPTLRRAASVWTTETATYPDGLEADGAEADGG